MPIFDFECKKCGAIEEHIITNSEHVNGLRCVSVIGDGDDAKTCFGKLEKKIVQTKQTMHVHELIADRILREQGHRKDFDYAQNRALNHLPKE